MALVPGQTFGNYQIVRLVGEGGFGEVYEAWNQFLQRRAAIKVLHTGMLDDPELVRRFLNEARAASAIRHPNIIEVLDAGVTPEGEPYILMEFLEGDSLQKLLQQQGRMPVSMVQEIARQAGSALSAAHAAGIVHRDLKPENIFLMPDPVSSMGFRVKVLDFGIAKVRLGGAWGSTLKTQAGQVMGSPAYMSPEQCRDSSDVDRRSDIYSLGCLMYEVLTGQPAFSGSFGTGLLHKHLSCEPPRFSEILHAPTNTVLGNLEKVLTHQKQRGNWGEASLELVLGNFLPPNQFKMQYQFDDGETVDAAIFTKEGIIPVDAKFSLDNYNRLSNAIDEAQKTELEKTFKNDLKLRIDENSKYVRPKEGPPVVGGHLP